MKVLIIARNDLKNGAIFWIWNSISQGFKDNGYDSEVINQEDFLLLNKFDNISLIILDISQIQL